MSKSHSEVVRECAQAATACWNHYSDIRLTDEQMDNLHRAVNANLPVSIKTTDWQRYADDKERELQAEEAELLPGERSIHRTREDWSSDQDWKQRKRSYTHIKDKR